MIKILGAGLSGLSAAVNLAKGGEYVEVHELNENVGMHTKPNFQGLICDEPTIEAYLKRLNLNPKFIYHPINRVYFCTRNKEFDIESSRSFPFVCRGGKQSLEYGLYEEAKKLGVKFKFKSRIAPSNVDIIATGHKSVDGAVFGAIYKDNGVLKNRLLIMYDDRYSPNGWYIYATRHFKGYIKVMNCVSKPNTGKAKELFLKAINEREILKKIVGGQEPVEYLEGVGGVSYPICGMVNGQYYIGEAAGLQDPFRGFGMHYALESGKLAADAILQNKDYDTLLMETFMPQMKFNFGARFIVSLLGDRFIEYIITKKMKGVTGKFDSGSVVPQGILAKAAIEIFFRMELLKRSIMGRW